MPLLMAGNVDVYAAGHWHYYEVRTRKCFDAVFIVICMSLFRWGVYTYIILSSCRAFGHQRRAQQVQVETCCKRTSSIQRCVLCIYQKKMNVEIFFNTSCGTTSALVTPANGSSFGLDYFRSRRPFCFCYTRVVFAYIRSHDVLSRYQCTSPLVMVGLRVLTGSMKTALAPIATRFHQRGSSQLHLGANCALCCALRPSLRSSCFALISALTLFDHSIVYVAYPFLLLAGMVD